MPDPKFILRAIHIKSKEQVTLQLRESETWEVGRDDGTVRPDKWAISFDPALSRDHFRVSLQGCKLAVGATKNRHPILFQGQPLPKFVAEVGQHFTTAHLRFEFTTTESNAEKTSTSLDVLDPESLKREIDLLTVSAMTSVLINGGAGFGKVFSLLNRHHTGWLKPILHDLEAAVLHRGEPLSKALGRYPEVFSEVFVATIEMGESGDLGQALNRLYHQLAQDLQQRGVALCESPRAVAKACLNLADLLERGGSETQALTLAAKATGDEPVRKAFLELARQLQAGNALSECYFPPALPAIFPGFIAAHQAVGTIPSAFKGLAELLV